MVRDFNIDLEEKKLNRYLFLEEVDNGFTKYINVPDLCVFDDNNDSSEFTKQTALGNIYVNYKALVDVAEKELKKELKKFFNDVDKKIQAKGFNVGKISYSLSNSGVVVMKMTHNFDADNYLDTLDLTREFSYIFGDLKLRIVW